MTGHIKTLRSAALATAVIALSAGQALAGDDGPPNDGSGECEVTEGHLYQNNCQPSSFPAGEWVQITHGALPNTNGFMVEGNSSAFASLYCRVNIDLGTAAYRGVIAENSEHDPSFGPANCFGSYASRSFCGTSETCQHK